MKIDVEKLLGDLLCNQVDVLVNEVSAALAKQSETPAIVWDERLYTKIVRHITNRVRAYQQARDRSDPDTE